MTAKVDIKALFGAERERVLRVIRRIVGDRATAEDLAQEAFVRLWDRPTTGNDRSYLFRTAQNLAIDHVRARRVRAAYAGAVMPVQIGGGAAAPDAALAARQELDILREALRSLPERAQRVFLLNRLDGLSYGEIAARLGVSVSTVEKDMIRALERCRRRLSRSGP